MRLVFARFQHLGRGHVVLYRCQLDPGQLWRRAEEVRVRHPDDCARIKVNTFHHERAGRGAIRAQEPVRHFVPVCAARDRDLDNGRNVVGQPLEKDRVRTCQRHDKLSFSGDDAGNVCRRAVLDRRIARNTRQHLINPLVLGAGHCRQFPTSLHICRRDRRAIHKLGIRVDLQRPDREIGARCPFGQNIGLNLPLVVEVHRAGVPERVPAERNPAATQGRPVLVEGRVDRLQNLALLGHHDPRTRPECGRSHDRTEAKLQCTTTC